MKKIVMICAAMVVFISMIACNQERRDTHHYVETEEFTLKVDGKRLSSQKEVDAFPKDTMCNPDDTLRLHDNVTSVALCIEQLSNGWYSWSEPYHGIHWKDITIVRQGTKPHDYKGKVSSYGSKPYNIDIPESLLSDTVEESTTLRTWLEGWMDAIFATDDELFSFLATHGYDIVCTGIHTQIYPHARNAYNDLFIGIL